MTNDGWYDSAQICTNGHMISWMSVSKPRDNRRFCEKCGAQAITNCQYCKTAIRGYYHEGPLTSGELDRQILEALDPPPDTTPYNLSLKTPSFCSECGKPYPWTEGKLKAAQDLADKMEGLKSEEKALLKRSLDDIVKDSPQTNVAAIRFKKIMAKAGGVAATAFRDIIVDIASETAKKVIWPTE